MYTLEFDKKKTLDFHQTKYFTHSGLDSLAFNQDEILNIIRVLNLHTAHGDNVISIRIIKMRQINIKTFKSYILEFNKVMLLPRYMKKDLILYQYIKRVTNS